MHEADVKSICGTNDGTDIEVVLPIFDRYLEWVAFGVQIRHYGWDRPITVVIQHISAIPIF